MRCAGRLGVAAVLLVLAPAELVGQRCPLQISAPARNLVGTPASYTTYLGGGTVTIRCGGALMTGDSAVHFEADARAEMLGDVAYRDTARTLSADRLVYFETSGQVVATGDVELVRLATGARLEGPRVSFFRAGTPGGRTLATGRPRMTIPSEDRGEPIIVVADEADFVGDTIAVARGNVVIERSDFDATADSAWFVGNRARLYGRPVVQAEGMRLEGDSIRAWFEPGGGGLERLQASGDARGTGQSLRLESGEIVVEWSATAVERIEAFGGDRAIAASESFLVAGDSLDVALSAGAPDSVIATGTARTFELEAAPDSASGLVEPDAGLAPERNWIEGDTIRAWFEAAARSGQPESRIRRLRSTGAARSFFATVRADGSGDRPSRNYILGKAIEIRFAGGEPERVFAEQAIGVFLEPTDEGGSP